jgi:hypothetical protein
MQFGDTADWKSALRADRCFQIKTLLKFSFASIGARFLLKA